MHKKETIKWILALNYWILVPIWLLLFPFFSNLFITKFNFHLDQENWGVFIGEITTIISFIFYAILVLLDTERLTNQEAIKKWWTISWKYNLATLLFLIPLIFLISYYVFYVGEFLIAYLLIANLLLFISIILRNKINTEIIFPPILLLLSINIIAVIRNFITKGFAYTFAHLIILPPPRVFLYFATAVIAYFISFRLLRVMKNKKFNIGLSIASYIYFLSMWIFPITRIKLTGPLYFLAEVILAFLISLFYFLFNRTKNPSTSSS